MKLVQKRSLELCLAVELLLTAVPLAATDYRTEIRAASGRLLSDSRSAEETEADLASLVGILGRMAREDTALSKDAQTTLLKAADSFRANPSLEGPGRAALDRAWRELSGGRAFSFPSDVQDISDAKTRVRGRIDDCLAAIKSGDRGRAIRYLLEALLMVMTPLLVR